MSARRALSCSAIVIAMSAPVALAQSTPPPSTPPSLNLSTSPASPLGNTAPPAQNPQTGGGYGFSPNQSNNTPNLQLQGIPEAISVAPTVGLFPQFGRNLLDDGIDFHGNSFERYESNTTAGVLPGHNFNLALLQPALDLDLAKLAGIPGGVLHLVVSIFGFRDGFPQAITQTGGFLTGFQTTPVTDPDILSVFTYEQKLLNNRLSIEFGRTNVYHYFLLPNSIDPFTYFSSTFEVGGDFNSPPYPVWGGRATYHLSTAWYVQAGAFEDDFRRSVANSNNFGDPQASGAQILAEIAERTEFNTAAFPSNLEAGFEWNTRDGYSNIKGANVAATRLDTAADYAGGGVFFFQGQKVLWRGHRPLHGPPPNIAIYGAVDASVDKPQPIDMDTLAGFTFQGLIPGRPLDVLELQAHYQRLSAIEANYETLIHRIFVGPGPSQPRDNWAFETAASVQLTPWLTFRPYVQYFVDPDNLYDPAQKRRPSDGFEAGVLAVVPIGRFLGTSNKPF